MFHPASWSRIPSVQTQRPVRERGRQRRAVLESALATVADQRGQHPAADPKVPRLPAAPKGACTCRERCYPSDEMPVKDHMCQAPVRLGGWRLSNIHRSCYFQAGVSSCLQAQEVTVTSESISPKSRDVPSTVTGGRTEPSRQRGAGGDRAPSPCVHRSASPPRLTGSPHPPMSGGAEVS